MICWNREPATHIPLSCPDSYLPLQSVFFLLFQVTLHTSHGSHFFLKLFSTQPFKEQVQNHVLAPLIMYKKQVEQIALAINLRNPFVWVEYRILISECIYNQLKFESVQPVLDTCSHSPLQAGPAITMETDDLTNHGSALAVMLVLNYINSCLDDQIAISSQKETRQHSWGRGWTTAIPHIEHKSLNTACKSSQHFLPVLQPEGIWLRSCKRLWQSQTSQQANHNHLQDAAKELWYWRPEGEIPV